ncbi:Transcriptional regulator, NifA subfamily, Fis family [Thiocapsa sp. KS1]|nr:Transcriptional regulator, NifA subfamily, Fis family [Thiocapsa sp. KS1]
MRAATPGDLPEDAVNDPAPLAREPGEAASPDWAAHSETSFEDLLTDLAASFINVEASALDAHIQAALRRIVRFLGLDRCTIGRFDDALAQWTVTHSWAQEGIAPIPSPLAEAHFPYLVARVRAGLPTIAQRLSDLPPEASLDRQSLLRLGQKSLAVFPLSADAQVLGWVSFGAVRREHAWPDDLVRRLRLIAGIFANALMRRRKETALKEALAENVALRERVEAENAVWREEALLCGSFDDLVGESPILRRVLLQVEQVARTDSTVLVLGETGTGKDLIATAIHRRSRRAEHPLIRVNCAALPPTLIESELFGHEKGAFTGAIARKIGRFEVAHGGTLVLDEIGELPRELQAKLLRVLQSGEFERLGATATRRSDARVIASTNRDLEAMSRDGSFRPDLFYRLSVFPITVPPLRERKEDIALLTAYFVEKLRAKLGRPALRIPDRAVAALMAYDWPGNVRELENIVERSMILSPGATMVVDVLPRTTTGARATTDNRSAGTDNRTLDEVERDHILAVCAACDWRINGTGNAAERLGINPNTLRSRMLKLGIARPPGSRPRRP